MRYLNTIDSANMFPNFGERARSDGYDPWGRIS